MKKRIVLLLAVCILLGAFCVLRWSLRRPAEEAASEAEEFWGAEIVEDSSTPAPEISTEHQPESPEPDIQQEMPEEPSPEPSAEPLDLEALMEPGPEILAGGEAINSWRYGDVLLISAEELSERFSWFQWLMGRARPQFTRINGSPFTIPCLILEDPEELKAYTSDCGICIPGEQPAFYLPVELLSEEIGTAWLYDGETDTGYLTEPLNLMSIPVGIDTPILVYHGITDNLPGGNDYLFVSPADFRAQLEYLLSQGYEPIFFSDLMHLEDYEKPILLTFDDGYADNYYEMFPIIQEYGVKVTCFVITGMLGSRALYMNADQVLEMWNSGLVDIQSHTYAHKNLAELPMADQIFEMDQSRLDILHITGRIPNVICYPLGSGTGYTLELARDRFCLGVTTEIRRAVTWSEDPMALPRIIVERSYNLQKFRQMLEG